MRKGSKCRRLHQEKQECLPPVMLENRVNSAAEDEEHERSHDEAPDMEKHHGNHIDDGKGNRKNQCSQSDCSFIRKRIAFVELHQPFFVFQIDSCYPDSIVERLLEINKDVATVFIYWKAAPGFSFGQR